MAQRMYCQNCGTVGVQRTYTKGSFGVEVLLWLLMILPGLIYSLWRLTTRYPGCPQCGAANMIPIDSPKAQAAFATNPQLAAQAHKPVIEGSQFKAGTAVGCPQCAKTVRVGDPRCKSCGAELAWT